MSPYASIVNLGLWICRKYRKQAQEVGTQQAARNLRKQGFSLEQSVVILLSGVA